MQVTWEAAGVLIAGLAALCVACRYVIKADINEALQKLDERYMVRELWGPRIRRLERAFDPSDEDLE